ncbi:hypothetical protein B0H13DRAFT_2410081 [Mycena leptocephala]|nr:hypothetical protein B0H13DRAFT_2410081 [Mycena leptocephala]
MAANIPPLDENLWNEIQFLSSQTGIYDADELKKHVRLIQAKAYQIVAYPCIRTFNFTRLRMAGLPAYSRIKMLLRGRPDAILLDLGCCFGTDIRKVAADGFPLQNLVACDLHREFWNFGHELFRSTPETFPVAFLAGDVLDRSFLAPAELQPTSTSPSAAPLPALSNITSLTTLNGHVSLLHISYVFHHFDEQKQTDLACSIAGLLSPLPGSMIFGSQVGKITAGPIPRPPRHPDDEDLQMFSHSPESWTTMWENIFPKGTARVEAALRQREECHPTELLPPVPGGGGDDGVLTWSITRL